MKYSLIALLIFFAACKGGTGTTVKDSTSDVTKDSTQVIVNGGGTNIDSANEPGQRLIAANDCFTCHQISKESVGPSYIRIANHYDDNNGNVENLAHKIIKGGKGLWGQNAMTPHPNLSEADAQEMVRYIFTLKNSSDTTK
jgi:cytochrome c